MREHHVPVGDASIYAVETGDPDGRPFVFLHGWPESSRTWVELTARAGDDIRAVAVDLPGVGASTGAGIGGTKREIADSVHHLIHHLGLTGATLVGHDIGGMVTYAYLRAYQDVERAVIMDVPIPGVAPWDDFIREPFLWHFALHAAEALPEALVRGRQRVYFDYFYDLLAADPAKIGDETREALADAYATDDALAAGFGWYRAFARDAEDNRQAATHPDVPVLYLRGGAERGGDIGGYVQGLRESGLQNVLPAVVPDAGHFPQHEAPGETWRCIARFSGLPDRPVTTSSTGTDGVREIWGPLE
jgi:pimeloyl-ACP methyl ester carboxylesterase